MRTATVTEKLIAVNVAVFVLFYFFRFIFFLFGIETDILWEFLVFPKEPGEFIFKPWTIITYAFLHSGIWHILFNMLILYFSGFYFLQFFSPKKLLNTYFLGAICGALIFMLSYNLFPAFAGVGRTSLVGASAAVMAVLVAVATHVPNLRIRLMLIGSIKFWWLAAFMVVLDIVQMPISNPGGHLAHLGGAAFGFFYAKQLGMGNDIASGFGKMLDWFGNLFSGKSTEKKARMKTVYKKKKTSASFSSTSVKSKKEKQEKIDAILDKIGKSGYDSLTKQEKDFLFKAGKEK